jgi:hypothetical protein
MDKNSTPLVPIVLAAWVGKNSMKKKETGFFFEEINRLFWRGGKPKKKRGPFFFS